MLDLPVDATRAQLLDAIKDVIVGKAAHDDVVDVAVVEGAIRRAPAVVTSNEAHVRAIARAVQAELRIERI